MKTKKQLEKGCGERCFCEHIKDDLKCGTVWNKEKHYCIKCLETLTQTNEIIEMIENKRCQRQDCCDRDNCSDPFIRVNEILTKIKGDGE